MPSCLRAHFKVTALAASAFALGFHSGTAREELIRSVPLVSTSETVLGEAVSYPAGKPKLTASILTIEPGAETGWHTHGAPPIGIVLDGELTVDYGDKGKRTYKKGDALVETMSTPHNGRNTGSDVMRLFVVFAGSEGIANTTKVEKP